MIAIKNMEMPKRCTECEFCINQKTSDYGTFGECLLYRYKKVNSLCDYRDVDCPLSNVTQMYTDTDGNAELFTYKNGKEREK